MENFKSSVLSVSEKPFKIRVLLLLHKRRYLMYHLTSTDMILSIKIKDFINNNSLRELEKFTGVSEKTLLRIAYNDGQCKYYKKTLDILYEFFEIPFDGFYKENMKKWNPKTPSLLGSLVRYKRIEANKDLGEIAKEIKVDKRALARMEAGDSQPSYNSYTLTKLFETLKFSDEEKAAAIKMIESVKILDSILKKYEKK